MTNVELDGTRCVGRLLSDDRFLWSERQGMHGPPYIRKAPDEAIALSGGQRA